MDQKTQSLLLGLITILLWGSLATIGNLLIHLPPFFVLGVSFLIGSLPGFFRPKEMFSSGKSLLWGTGGYFGYHFFLFYSFRHAPPLEANLINYLWPVVMVILTPLAFPEVKLKIYHIAGAALSVIGSVILVAGKGVALQKENLLGYGLALLAAITWPVYSIGKKKMKSSSVWEVGGFCLASGVLCLITHFIIEPGVVVQANDLSLLILLGLGPFGIAFYSWDLAMKNGDSRVIGALAYLTPVLSTLGLVLFAGQEITTTTFWAIVLIISGASSGLLDFFPRKS